MGVSERKTSSTARLELLHDNPLDEPITWVDDRVHPIDDQFGELLNLSAEPRASRRPPSRIGCTPSAGQRLARARDLGPRIAHALLPIPGKGSSDWNYAWIPVVGPMLGGIIAVVVYQIVVS